MSEQTNNYELTFILSPQIQGDDLNNTKNEIQDLIKKANGIIEFKREEKKELAYPINKQGQGIYLTTNLIISPEKINDISKELKINKKILRHLIRQLSIPKPEKPKKEKKPEEIKREIIEKKEKIEKRKIESDKTKLEEIDKKLDEIIEEI
ncbi:MAG: 30S ribosomal protein S6 [Patescibacteria group bacterium]